MIARMLTLLSLMFSLQLSANTVTSYIKGDGRFYALEEDNLSFVKQQLLFNAYQDVISKVLSEEGLNKELFWKSFDEKFETYFLPIQQELETKYGMDKEEVSDKDKEAFQKILRARRLKAKSTFKNLRSCVQSYSIKKMSRSSQMANSRFIKIQAKVNKVILGKIYVDLTREGESRMMDKLYVSVDYSIHNMTWNDTGVELKQDFVNVIHNSWKEYLIKNLEGLVQEIVFTDENLERELKKFAQIPTEVTNLVAEGTESPRGGSFSNSVWLKIRIDLNKIKEDTLLMNREFVVGSSYILQDLGTNDILSFNDTEEANFTFSFDDPQKLSSQLATRVYNAPILKLKDIKNRLVNIPANQNEIHVLLKNIDNIQEVFAFNNFIQGQGVSYQIQPSLDRLNISEVRIGLRFLGTKESFMEFLSKLNNASFGKDLFLKIEDPARPYVFSVFRKQVEKTFQI